jgi:hypothetical protein
VRSRVLDPVLQAGDLMGHALETTVAQALRRAQVCGCRDCRTDAMQTVAWAERLLGVPQDD